MLVKSRMNELIPILFSFGVALLGGFIAGYALRKVIKIAAIIIGVFILVMIGLQGAGWVKADYAKMSNDTVSFVSNTEVIPQVTSFVNQFNPFVFVMLIGGGILGFIKAG